MSIEVIGIDHIYLAVANMERSEKFYDTVMEILGFKKNTFVNDGDRHVQYFNRHFGFVLRPARAGSPGHGPLAPGLHHFCFRVEDAVTVDRTVAVPAPALAVVARRQQRCGSAAEKDRVGAEEPRRPDVILNRLGEREVRSAEAVEPSHQHQREDSAGDVNQFLPH